MGGKRMFHKLRKEYPEFIYESFEVEETSKQYVATYHYRIKELFFSPQIIVDKKQITNTKVDKEFLNYLFFPIWII